MILFCPISDILTRARIILKCLWSFFQDSQSKMTIFSKEINLIPFCRSLFSCPILSSFHSSLPHAESPFYRNPFQTTVLFNRTQILWMLQIFHRMNDFLRSRVLASLYDFVVSVQLYFISVINDILTYHVNVKSVNQFLKSHFYFWYPVIVWSTHYHHSWFYFHDDWSNFSCPYFLWPWMKSFVKFSHKIFLNSSLHISKSYNFFLYFDFRDDRLVTIDLNANFQIFLITRKGYLYIYLILTFRISQDVIK